MASGDRSALVTGGSSGIGLAIAELLASEGYGITLCARRPEKLFDAAEGLRAKGYSVQEIAVNVASEDGITSVAGAHRQRFGGLDVLVNNAGIGIGAGVAELDAKKIDIQLGVNLRAIMLFYRECLDMLRTAAAAHGSAMVVNLASIAGLRAQPWISVYSAAKHGVIGFTRAMNKELGGEGIKSTAICPAYVDTDMTAWVRDQYPREKMIRVEDIAGAVRWLISTSPQCVVPEIAITLPGDAEG